MLKGALPLLEHVAYAEKKTAITCNSWILYSLDKHMKYFVKATQNRHENNLIHYETKGNDIEMENAFLFEQEDSQIVPYQIY